jgi:hypothetical protein
MQADARCGAFGIGMHVSVSVCTYALRCKELRVLDGIKTLTLMRGVHAMLGCARHALNSKVFSSEGFDCQFYLADRGLDC